MDRLTYTSMLVRSLRGAALSIWAIMVLNPAKVVWEVEELIDATKYKKNAVLAGRRELITAGLAAHIGARYGLRLTDSNVQQLPLPISLDLNQGHQQGEELSDEVGKIDLLEEPIDLMPVEVDLINLEVGKINLPAVVVVDQEIATNQAIANQQQQQQHGARLEKSTSLDTAGIHGKKRRELLDDDWVTPKRIDAWRSSVQRMADAGYHFRDATGTGFLIDQLLRHIDPFYELAPTNVAESWINALQQRNDHYAKLNDPDRRSHDHPTN